MTREDRPPAVRAWLRRPLFWTLVAAGFATWLFWLELHDLWRTERVTEDGLVVQAVADGDWDGESPLIATYEHPSGRSFKVEVDVWKESLLPRPGGEVPLVVAPSDPTTAMVRGDAYYSSWIEYSLFVVPGLLAWALRRWSLRQVTRVAGSVGPAFQMRAVASSPGWWSVRWRLHLYPLDSAVDALPVCTVLLIAPPLDREPRMVEVKGQPRPWGRVMVRDGQSDELLWPSGRCLRSPGWGRHALESGQGVHRVDRAKWWGLAALALAAVGMIADVFVDDYDDVGQRDYRVSATVVTVGGRTSSDFVDVGVELNWLGKQIDGTVGMSEAPPVGSRIKVVIDPRHPTRIWGIEEEVPGGNVLGGVYGVAMLLGLTAVGIRVADRRRARRRAPSRLSSAVGYSASSASRRSGVGAQWHGLSIRGGRLWIGPERKLTKRANAVLEPDGPVLITRRGEVRLAWDDGFPDGWSKPAGWQARGEAGSRANVPAVIFETGKKNRWDVGTQVRITGGWDAGLAGIAFEPIPALLRYLVDTPEARGSLTDEGKLLRLLRDLSADFSWLGARHGPPGEPFAGDRLDVHLAVERVLRTAWPRRIQGRPVRGEPVPLVEELIEPVRSEIPSRIRDHITDDQIRDRVLKLLDVDPWPFDALIQVT